MPNPMNTDFDLSNVDSEYDSLLQEQKETELKHWFDMGLWHYEYAARLTLCHSRLLCIKSCVADESQVDCYLLEAVKRLTKLYENEHWPDYDLGEGGFPEKIKPAEFIAWLQNKKTFEVPDNMKKWFSSNKQEKNHLTVADARKKIDELEALLEKAEEEKDCLSSQLDEMKLKPDGCDGKGYLRMVCEMRRSCKIMKRSQPTYFKTKNLAEHR